MIHFTYSFTSFQSLYWDSFQYFSMSIKLFITSIFRIECIIFNLQTLRIVILHILLITFLNVQIIYINTIYIILVISMSFYCIFINEKIVLKILILECVYVLWIYNLKFINFGT